MSKVKIWILPLVLILALLWAGCEKKGDPVAANIPPDTRILSYVISSSAEKDTLGDPTTSYAVTVYWAGSDLDGTIRGYQTTTTGSFDPDALPALATQGNFVFDFADAASSYTLWVRAVDNNNVPDPTAALVTITRAYAAVETKFIDGPPNGGVVGEGVRYKIGGNTGTGTITQMEYKVNEVATWEVTDVDELGEVTIDLLGLAAGPNVAYFRAVRDDGVKDDTPLAVSVVVKVDEYTPTITNTSPVVDGGGWFEGVSLTFSWTVEARYYYGSLPSEPYTFEAIPTGTDPVNWNADPDAALASGWSSESSFEYSPVSGANTFYLKVRDIGGGVDTMRINFSAAAPTFDKGILVVNGDDPNTYLGEMDPRYSVGAFWGTLPVSFWDLFGDDDTPSMTLPATGVTYIGGGTQLLPDLMAQYSTVVWLGNNFSGVVADLALWQLTPIYAYLQAGGNVVFYGRETATFMDASLSGYLTLAASWRDGSAPGDGSNAGLITLSQYIPVFPGLVAMTPFTAGNSRNNVFTVSAFGDFTTVPSGNWDAEVDGWDGVKGYTKADLSTTLLFVHKSGGSTALPFTRGLGVWRHPNFQFSSMDAGNEFPSTPDQKRGNFISLTGRNYRSNVAATTANFEFILRNMCGEQ
jgi:hypothetical protein